MSVYFIGEFASCHSPHVKKIKRRTMDAVKTAIGLEKNEESAMVVARGLVRCHDID